MRSLGCQLHKRSEAIFRFGNVYGASLFGPPVYGANRVAIRGTKQVEDRTRLQSGEIKGEGHVESRERAFVITVKFPAGPTLSQVASLQRF